MLDNVEIYTKALIRAIQDSREYREYEQIKRRVAGMPELKRQINQYRKETFRLQNYADEQQLYDLMEEFNRQHMEFRKDPLVNEYLSCELALCRMLQRSALMVAGAVDLELEDMIGEIRS